MGRIEEDSKSVCRKEDAMNHRPDILKEVDCVEVLTLIDNYTDALLEDTEVATRLPDLFC